MKKILPVLLMVVGVVFVAGGIYTSVRGFDAKERVEDELLAQNIVTTADASIPNARVKDARTAEAMADIIDVHARESTGGRTYAEIGRYLAVDGGDTNEESEALKDAAGNPVANPLRNVAFQASALRTSLFTSVMAFNVADLVIGLGVIVLVLGLALGLVGVALGGLAIPALARRFHVDPVAAGVR